MVTPGDVGGSLVRRRAGAAFALPENEAVFGVSKTDKTDTNYFSIGCSVLFLNWLRFQLKFTR